LWLRESSSSSSNDLRVRHANIVRTFAYLSLVVKLDRQIPSILLVLEALSEG